MFLAQGRTACNSGLSLRRIRETPALGRVIDEMLRDLNRTPDNFRKISYAVALIKLGERQEGERVLSDMEKESDVWVLLETAKAWLELGEKKKGFRILGNLENVSENTDLLPEIAEQYLKYSEFRFSMEKPLLKTKLERMRELARHEVEELLEEIYRREEIFELIDKTRKINQGRLQSNEDRVNAGQRLLELSNETRIKFEDIILIKKAIQDLAGSDEPEIKFRLAQILVESNVIFAWQADIFLNLIQGLTGNFTQNPLAAETALKALRNLGENYTRDLARFQDRLVLFKEWQVRNHAFESAYSQDIGRLSLRDNIVNALIESWNTFSGADWLTRKIMGELILENLGFWGINSGEARDFLNNIRHTEKDEDLRRKAQVALIAISNNEDGLRRKLNSVSEAVRQKLRLGIPVESSEDLLFLAALWTVYGNIQDKNVWDGADFARDLLLEILSETEKQSPGSGLTQDGWRWDMELVLFGLMFRPHPETLTKFKSYLFDKENFTRQSVSLDILTQAWWLEDSNTILRDFLRELDDLEAFEYFHPLMALRALNALFEHSRSFPEKIELALTALRLMDKFPLPLELPRFHPARQLIWLLGERLEEKIPARP